MRIKSTKANISYNETQHFFSRRAKKFTEENPYSVTMYQDNHPELVKARNEKELEKLLPKLELNERSRVIDIACGIGRWSDAVVVPIEEYCGIDFCEDFIELAKKRNEKKSNRFFYVSRSNEVDSCLTANDKLPYNRVLIVGALMYLNDDDVIESLEQIEKNTQAHSIICIREPIGIEERLTLKEQFSEELDDTYNAIYRTRDELVSIFEKVLISKGYKLDEEGFLFDEQQLNNRKETSQYYFVLKR